MRLIQFEDVRTGLSLGVVAGQQVHNITEREIVGPEWYGATFVSPAA